MTRSGLLLASLLLALAVAGCSSSVTAPPPQPAYQALVETGRFGYADSVLDADTIEVSYLTPEIGLPSGVSDEMALRGESEKARDLALLRALEIAEQRKVPAIRIVTERRDNEAIVRSHTSRRFSPFWSGLSVSSGYPTRYGFGAAFPFGGFYDDDDYYGGYRHRTWRNGQIRVIMTVDLLPRLDAKDATQLAVAPTLARLRQQWGQAVY